jgi:hypothetical protein
MWEKKVGDGPTTSAGPKTQATSVGKRTLVEQLPYAPAPPVAVPTNGGDASDPAAGDRTLGDRPDSALPQDERQAQMPTGLAIARSATAPPPASVPPHVSATLASAQGAPLPDPEHWSARVGADVSNARVVIGEGAPEAAGAIGARAFTVGNRVFMGAGHDAGTDGGNLLAHELTHVTQQQGSAPPASWSQLPFVDHGDPREVAARTHDGTRHGAGEQAIARDAVPDVDAAAYRRVFATQIGQDVLAYLTAHDLPTGSRFVTLPTPVLAAPALLGAGPVLMAA